MILLDKFAAFPPHLRGGVLCIGNFDGVHIGHAAMLTRGRDLARQSGTSFTVMTFDPHPMTVLRPITPRPPLTVPTQRQELLAAFGLDALLVIPTTREFLAMPAAEFLQRVVHDAIGATHIVEGPTFTFGRGARGDTDMLRRRGPAYGFQTTIVDSVEVVLADFTRANVSSSLIRWLISHGRVADAAKALGRPYTLRGPVVVGQKRGRTIGYPTANLHTPQLIPAAGIYAGRARTPNGTFAAAISIGTNPTFAGQTTTVEAYLLDFSGDLYLEILDLEFHRYLREMITFAGTAPLVRQMRRDVEQVRTFLGPQTPGAPHGSNAH